MKIEFLNDICDDGKYPFADPNKPVRLFDFNSLQAKRLQQAIEEIIIHNKKELDLTTLDFIHPVNCNLILQISEYDTGITSSDNLNFICTLTIEKYKDFVSLIRPFCDKKVTGFQWLYDLDVPIDLLFSPGGTW